jgi:hypothetical protein
VDSARDPSAVGVDHRTGRVQTFREECSCLRMTTRMRLRRGPLLDAASPSEVRLRQLRAPGGCQALDVVIEVVPVERYQVGAQQRESVVTVGRLCAPTQRG